MRQITVFLMANFTLRPGFEETRTQEREARIKPNGKKVPFLSMSPTKTGAGLPAIAWRRLWGNGAASQCLDGVFRIL